MLEEFMKLFARLVIATEAIAANGGGGIVADSEELQNVASGGADASLNAADLKKIRQKTNLTAAKAKAAFKKLGSVDAVIEEYYEDRGEPAKASNKSSSDAGDGKKKTSKPAADADAVEPTKEEIAAAQKFKKDLLNIGRGHNDYVNRLKVILKDFGQKAENVPEDVRDDILAAAKAEFEVENDNDI